MSYRLLNFSVSGETPRAGLLVGTSVVDLAGAFSTVDKSTPEKIGFDPSSTMSLLQHWDRVGPLLTRLAGEVGKITPTHSLDQVKLAAPLLYPTNIFCAAANYQDHFREMTGKDIDKSKLKPYFFNKVSRQTVIGPQEEIRKPHITEKLDWEAEIAVVIGRAGRNISAMNAFDHVAGYTIINDLSARDYLRRADWPALASDWLWQKSFDGSAPLGPWITPKSEIADPQNLSIRTWVNNTLEQDTHSKWMVFTIREQIEALSEHLTLLPGDVIATGTGSGVGNPKGKFLNPGDVCRIEIEGLGEIRNPVVKGE